MASLTERADGFVPIESYGVIGDGKSVALIARDGAVDWWTAPAMDSAPVFAALLDPADGGCFTLEPAVPYQASVATCPAPTCSRRRSPPRTARSGSSTR